MASDCADRTPTRADSSSPLCTPPTEGIGGWLILPAFALIAASLGGATFVYMNLADLKATRAPEVRTELIIETVVYAAYVLFIACVAVAFFRRRRTAPHLVIALLVANVLLSAFAIRSLVPAAIWIPYFLVSRRVKATFVFGPTNQRSSSTLTSEPSHAYEDRNGFGKSFEASRQSQLVIDECARVPKPNDAAWYVIHAGIELGPMSADELVQRTMAGEITADDLVKETGGKWIKAGDLDCLQQAFLSQKSEDESDQAAIRSTVPAAVSEQATDARPEVRQAAIDNPGSWNGIWLSKKQLACGACILLGLVAGSVVWSIGKGHQARQDHSATPAQIKPVPRFSGNPWPEWNDIESDLSRLGAAPDLDMSTFRRQYEQLRKVAIEQNDKEFASRIDQALIPEVTLAKQSSARGILVGTVHNGTLRGIEKLSLLITTVKWERTHETRVVVPSKTTATFSVFIGDALLEIKSFKVLDAR